MLDGEEVVLNSIDKCSRESRFLEMPTEFYNKITPSGMPPHELRLKKVQLYFNHFSSKFVKGCVVMLLRNLHVNRGLCNGTRLRVIHIGQHVSFTLLNH